MSRHSSGSDVSSAWLLSVPYQFLVGSLIATTITVTLLTRPVEARALMVLWQAIAIGLATWSLHLFSVTCVANRALRNAVFPSYNFVLAGLASISVIVASVWTLVVVARE